MPPPPHHYAPLSDFSVHDFIAATAGKNPTPGGGSVAALCGALAAALASMAMEYTLGKKAFAAYDAEIRQQLAQFKIAADMLQRLMAEDAAAYEALAELLKLPIAERHAHAHYTPTVAAAIRAPQTVAGFALSILERAAALIDKTNKFLVSDLGIAAAYAHATVHASELSVRINLPLLTNGQEAAEMKQAMRDLALKADGIYAVMHQELLRRL